MAELETVPSPKSQDHWVIECPVAAREASPLKNTVWPMTGVVCEATNCAVGADDAPTVTDWTDVAERPRSLVTVRLTLKVPVVAYECVTVLPDAVPPSPNVHAYDVIAEAPWPGMLAEASNVERTFICTGVGEIVNDAVGVDAGGRITPVGTRRIVTCSGFAVSKLRAGRRRDDLDAVAGQPLARAEDRPSGSAAPCRPRSPRRLIGHEVARRQRAVVLRDAVDEHVHAQRQHGIGLPSGPMAVTWIDDCDPPSWLMLSGSAVTLIDSARPEGPVSRGASV